MMEKVTQKKAWLVGACFVVLVFMAVTMPDSLLEQIGTWVLLAMLLPANYFPIFYTVAFRWWGGHLGRALFIKALGLAIVLDIALMVKYLGGEQWAQEIRFVAYTLVLIGMVYQSLVMTQIRIKANQHDRARRVEVEEPTDLKGVDMRPERT